jgi:PRC-barrel domain
MDGNCLAPITGAKEGIMISAKALMGFTLAATDGAIGEVDDCYFDDAHWTVRYFVVDTGGWLSGRRVLISPMAVRDVDPKGERVLVNLTREQVEGSPDIDTHRPVSRQHEISLLQHYGFPTYWYGPYTWGPAMLPTPPVPAAEGVMDEVMARAEQDNLEDAHLHSTTDTVGYAIEARDGAIGHVNDLLIDERTWTIRWLVVGTGNWLPGKQVLVAPEWVEDVAWTERAVRVGLKRAQIQDAPAYDRARPIEREYEQRLFSHYGRPTYWDRAA